MADVPQAPLEGSSSVSNDNYPVFFLTEDDGAGGLRAALVRSLTSEVINGQRLGAMAVGVIGGPSTPTTHNITLSTANVEYSLVLTPTNAIRTIAFRAREDADVRFAWESGKVAGPTEPYQTLKAGGEYIQSGLYITSPITLYFACGTGGVHVEVEVWE